MNYECFIMNCYFILALRLFLFFCFFFLRNFDAEQIFFECMNKRENIKIKIFRRQKNTEL